MKSIILTIFLVTIIGCSKESKNIDYTPEKRVPSSQTNTAFENEASHIDKIMVFNDFAKGLKIQSIEPEWTYVSATQKNADYICLSLGYDGANSYEEAQIVESIGSTPTANPYMIKNITPNLNQNVTFYGKKTFEKVAEGNQSEESFITYVNCKKVINL